MVDSGNTNEDLPRSAVVACETVGRLQAEVPAQRAPLPWSRVCVVAREDVGHTEP